MFQDEHLTNIHKKAIIGNLIKRYCGKFYTEYNIYAYDEFQPESIHIYQILIIMIIESNFQI